MGKLKDITDYLLGIGITDDEDAPEAGTPAMLESETPENEPDAAATGDPAIDENDPTPGGDPAAEDDPAAGIDPENPDVDVTSGAVSESPELAELRDANVALATENETLRTIIAEMGGIVPGSEPAGNIAPANDPAGDDPAYDPDADMAEQEAELARIRDMR